MMNFIWLWIAFLTSAKSSGIFDSPDVFLTVSSEPDCESRSWYKPWSWFQETLCDRRLELNWINFDKLYSSSAQDSDYVGLFSWDPTSPFSPQPPPPPPEKHKCPVSSVSQAALGYYKTTARYERRDDLSPGMNDPCFLGYWIAYVRVTTTKDNGTTSTKVLKSNCLKLHPFWMAELRESIGDLPVTSLMIPGTHNSGSWEKYKGVVSEINPLSAYEITQEESIYDQLMHGIRYLDVRVSYHPILPINFWVSHELLPQIPLTSLLSDVQRFVEETGRREIVFVDFHRFHSGLNRSEIHTQLIQLVDSHLGSYLVPHNQPVGMLTPNQLWNERGGNGSRTVFVTYPEPIIRKQYSFLWPPFQHSWANTNNISQLENFLGEDLQVFGCRGRYWTSMAELTATASDVLTRPQLGLRGMAQDVNRNVTLWFRRKAFYSRAMAIASDFFLGNNLIEMAIKANAHRAVCNYNDEENT